LTPILVKKPSWKGFTNNNPSYRFLRCPKDDPYCSFWCSYFSFGCSCCSFWVFLQRCHNRSETQTSASTSHEDDYWIETKFQYVRASLVWPWMSCSNRKLASLGENYIPIVFACNSSSSVPRYFHCLARIPQLVGALWTSRTKAKSTRMMADTEVGEAVTREVNKVWKGKNFTIEEDKQLSWQKVACQI
jgi:hypothetical protein